MRQTKQFMKELMIGLAIWSILIALILVLITGKYIVMPIGVLLGSLTAAGLLWHMHHHLDIALDLDEKNAKKHTQFAMVQRFFIMAAVLAIAMIFPKYIHPLGTVFGLFGMKMTAYIYPGLHGYLHRNMRK